MEKVSNTDVQLFLSDMLKNSRTELINSDTDELREIAEKRGLNFDDKRDFAFFKNVYAVTDKANKNGAVLPKEAVAAGLESINGKPVDIDHNRSYVIGHYLGGELKDETIYSYGVIYKNNFEGEWEEAQKLFEEGKLNTSFEIWCPEESREQHEDGTYSLKDITIAGGAILFTTEPAFEEAEVLELARKHTKVNTDLVFASKKGVITAKKESNQTEIEKARFNMWDFETILTLISKVKCPSCDEEWSLDVDMLDFENSSAVCTCYACEAKVGIDMTPKTNTLAQGRDIKAIYKLDKNDVQKKEEESSMTKEDIKKADEEKEVVEEVKEEVEVKEDVVEEVKEDVVPEVKEEEVEAEEETAEEVVEDEVETLKSLNAKLNEELKEAKARIASIEEAEKAEKIAGRKAALADYAKDLSDDDLLDETKYEMALLKKENAELKAGKVVDIEEASLEKGSRSDEGNDAVSRLASKVRKSFLR